MIKHLIITAISMFVLAGCDSAEERAYDEAYKRYNNPCVRKSKTDIEADACMHMAARRASIEVFGYALVEGSAHFGHEYKKPR